MKIRFVGALVIPLVLMLVVDEAQAWPRCLDDFIRGFRARFITDLPPDLPPNKAPRVAEPSRQEIVLYQGEATAELQKPTVTLVEVPPTARAIPLPGPTQRALPGPARAGVPAPVVAETPQDSRPHIRWMIRRDMPEVLAIEWASFGSPWSEEDFLRVLRQRNCIGMVAEHGERVIGSMIYELYQSKIVVLNFAVHPDFRRKGVGNHMVAKLVGKLGNNRRTRIELLVRASNLAGQIFFRANGFRATGLIRGFFEDTDEDAYVMTFLLDEQNSPEKEFVVQLSERRKAAALDPATPSEAEPPPYQDAPYQDGLDDGGQVPNQPQQMSVRQFAEAWRAEHVAGIEPSGFELQQLGREYFGMRDIEPTEEQLDRFADEFLATIRGD